MRRVTRLVALSSVAAGWLMMLTAHLPAQQAVDPLRAATAVLSAGQLQSLRYEVFGATYTAGAASTPVPRAMPLGLEISFVAGGRRYAGVVNERNLVDRATSVEAHHHNKEIRR